MKSTKYILVKQKLIPWKYIYWVYANRIFLGPKRNHRDTYLFFTEFPRGNKKYSLIHRLSKTYAVAIVHFRVPPGLCIKTRLGAQLFLWKWVLFAWEWKIISISKVEHLTLFWYRGPGELGNGLFNVPMTFKDKFSAKLVILKICIKRNSMHKRISLQYFSPRREPYGQSYITKWTF